MSRPPVNYGPQDIALANEILRSVVGSGVHGVAIAGTDDHDEMGVFVEPRVHVYGLREPIGHHVRRTRAEGERSGPGDTDLIVYGLRRYLRLATKGNPTALLPLFAPPSALLVCTDLGHSLRALRTAFLSQEAVRRFLGYMRRQHEKMLTGPGRPELVAAHGWDTKFGAHAVRLARQGLQIASTGSLTLPLPAPDRELVLAVKRGEVPREEVSALVVDHGRRIVDRLDSGSCALPPGPRLDLIEAWSVRAHEQFWDSERGCPAGSSDSRPDGSVERTNGGDRTKS